MHLELQWPPSAILTANATLRVDGWPPIAVNLDPGHMYRYWDRCVLAARRGQARPPALDALSAEQRAAISALPQWSVLRSQLTALLPTCEQVEACWHHDQVRISNMRRGGYVYVWVDGDHHEGAVLGGQAVAAAAQGEGFDRFNLEEDPYPPAAARPHPDLLELEPSQVVQLLVDGGSEALRAHLRCAPHSTAAVHRWAVQHLCRLPAAEVREPVRLLHEIVDRRFLPNHDFALPIDGSLLDAPSRVDTLMVLIASGAAKAPPDALFTETVPERVPRWIALGVDIHHRTSAPVSDRPGGYVTAVLAQRMRPVMLAALANAGADLSVLDSAVDGIAEDESSQAPTVLQHWMEWNWITLCPGAEPSAVAQQLVAALEGDSANLIDNVLDIEGVDELFVTDQELDEFLRRW